MVAIIEVGVVMVKEMEVVKVVMEVVDSCECRVRAGAGAMPRLAVNPLLMAKPSRPHHGLASPSASELQRQWHGKQQSANPGEQQQQQSANPGETTTKSTMQSLHDLV